MRALLVALSLTTLPAMAPCAAAQDGFRPLFDGEMLEGWDGDPRFWSVEDGEIVGRSTAEVPCERTTYLVRSGEELGDFELRLSFRLAGGNSGVQLRSREVERWQVAGYQADVSEGGQWTGCLYEQDGRGVVATRGQRVTFNRQGAKRVERFADAAEILRAVDLEGWNEYRIVARGPRVSFEINGTRTCELVDRDPARAARKGLVAFQLHQGPPMEVRFRDVRVRELEPAQVPVEERADDEPVTLQARPVPSWIWVGPETPEGQEAVFHRALRLERPLRRAVLTGSCDNQLEVRVNGAVVARRSDWWRPVRAVVTEELRAGDNLVAAWGRNDGGPAGLELALELEFEDGARETLVTDATWLATDDVPDEWGAPAASYDAWRPAHVFGPLGMQPWGTLPPPSAGAEGEALPAEELELPPGFRAELVYSVPRAREGSWVSLAVGDRGRLYASDQGSGLYRITPPPLDDSQAGALVERVPVELGGAQGLLWAFDALYVVVNGRGSGLYRLRDTDGDDALDDVELLKRFEGQGEHGPHAVILAPDGETLYVVGGNHTKLPEGVRARPWAEDQLLPRRPDPGGHAVGVMAPGGWVCRTDPHGREWQLVCWGLRNAYDADFSPSGVLFTYDADMEWDVGLPWYRPTRICQVLPEAEFGWRHGSGKWPDYFPDSLPAAVDIGLGSPTGVAFGTRARFPERWRAAFFIADWAYGTIFAVHLEPEGASYAGSFEPFVRGRPLPVTDLVVGGDGALYFTVGGRGTQSGLYRVTWEGELDEPRGEELSNEELRASLQRQLYRMLLEAPSAESVWRDLGSEDRFERYAARRRWEDEPVALIEERLRREQRPRVVIQALVALARIGGSQNAGFHLEKLEALPLESLSADELLEALRAAALGFIRLGAPPDEARARLADRLSAMFPAGEPRVDRELARTLVYLEDPRVIPGALERMRRAGSQEDVVHYAWVLRNLRAGWTPAQRREYFRWLDEIAARYSGGASFAKYLAALREDAWATLSDAERAALEAQVVAQVEEELPALDLEGREAHRWSVGELAPRLGGVHAGRSFEAGEAAFFSATCHTCHRIAGRGGSTGPDLTGAGSRFSPRDLLETILEPSKVVSDQYVDTELRTHDDELLVGRVLEEDERRYVLLTLPPEEEQIELEKSEIASARPHPLSRMPEGLVDLLSEAELLDLLAYVLSGGEPRDPAFGR